MDTEKHISLKKVISKIAFNSANAMDYIKSLSDELNYHLQTSAIKPEIKDLLLQAAENLDVAIKAFSNAAVLTSNAKELSAKTKGDIL